MKKVFVVILTLFLISCSSGSEKNKVGSNGVKAAQMPHAVQPQADIFQSVNAAQAEQLMRTKKDLLVLDVRTPPELKEGKIKNSILVPFWDIAKGRYQVPADKPVLLVCAVGGRSYAIGQLLHKKGYPEVYSLSGGISGWKNAGMPVVY